MPVRSRSRELRLMRRFSYERRSLLSDVVVFRGLDEDDWLEGERELSTREN